MSTKVFTLWVLAILLAIFASRIDFRLDVRFNNQSEESSVSVVDPSGEEFYEYVEKVKMKYKLCGNPCKEGLTIYEF